MSIFSQISLLLKLKQIFDSLRRLTLKDIPTTVVGVVGAVAIAVTAYLEQHGITTKDLINVITLAALGFLAKSIGLKKESKQ